VKRIFHFLEVILFLNIAFGQNNIVDGQTPEGTYESLFENSSDEANQQLLVDDFEYLTAHPVNLRNASYGELLRVPFISPFLAEKIILLRDTVELASVDSLRYIPEFSDEVITKIAPFITFEEYPKSVSYLTPSYVRTRLRTERRLQTSEGFRERKFLGDPNSMYQKMQIGNAFFEIGAVFEKDIAEQYSNGFISGYLSAQQIGIVEKLIIGNYSFSAGEGLLAARNIATSKGTNVIGQIHRRSGAISPSLSLDESRFYRGGAAKVHLLNGTCVIVYSNRIFPASVDSLNAVTSIYSSGLYRTPADLVKKDAAGETIYGGSYAAEIFPFFTMGTGILHFNYDRDISPQVIDLGNKRSLTAAALFGEYQWEQMNFFGEVASNNGEQFSSHFGLTYATSREITVSFSHRSYSQRYNNPVAKPFGERNNIGDGETGNYIGLLLYPLKRLKISSYADFYTLPDRETFSTKGFEYFICADLTVFKYFELDGHLKVKRKEQVFIRLNDDQRVQKNYRIGYTYKLFPGIVLSQRMEFVTVHYAPSQYAERGMGTFVDVKLQRRNSPISANIRFIVFDTDSYDSRVYQYETDVRGGYSNPPLFGSGSRWYCLLRYEPIEKLSLSFRYSETKKLYDDVIGSGDDAILGHLDNQVTVQVDFEL